MAEAERGAIPQLRFDLAIERAVDFVRGEHHHDVRRRRCLFDQGDRQTRGLGFKGATRFAAKPDDHVDPAVL